MNQEQRFLLDIWLRAYASPEPLSIDCGTNSQAVQFRMALYNAAKPFKDEAGAKAKANPLEHEAVVNCSVSLQPDKHGSIVQIRQKMLNALLQKVSAQLGIELPGEKEKESLRGSAERLMKELQQVETDPAQPDPLAFAEPRPSSGLGIPKPEPFGTTGRPYYLSDTQKGK